MNGITFISINENISKHSFRDFGLVLTSQEIGLPAPKTYIVEIEGRNGSLDLSESFGEIKYENRELKFTFDTRWSTCRPSAASSTARTRRAPP